MKLPENDYQILKFTGLRFVRELEAGKETVRHIAHRYSSFDHFAQTICECSIETSHEASIIPFVICLKKSALHKFNELWSRINGRTSSFACS